MRAVKWRSAMLAAAPLILGFAIGCAGFWDLPTSSNSSFTLTNSGNISVAPGANSSNTSTITITPASSFTGTVTLACSITSSPSGATSPTTCSLSPVSVTFSSSTASSTAQTSTLTANTSSSTTTGTYNIKVTGTSGTVSQTTTLCAEVGTGTCTPSGGGNNSGNFYVLNQATRQIAAFAISSGSLVNIVGSPYSLSAAPLSIAIAPNGNFLYVGTAAGIFLYSIGSGGQLTLANNSATISQDIATAMQVDASGQWLLEAGPNFTQLVGIRINPSTGVPASTTAQAVLLPAATIQQIAISPDNTQVFVALGTSGTQNLSFVSGSTGSPFGSSVNIPTITVAGSALSVAVDPASRLFYIGETAALPGTSTSGGLRVFNYATRTELAGSPFSSGGLSPVVILPLPYGTNQGNYVYVANRNISGSTTGLIQGFFVTTSGTTNSISAMSNAATAGTLPAGMVQESMGNYLLVVNSGGNTDLQAFTFDTTTAGKLDLAISSATGTDPVQASGIIAAP